MVNATEFAGRLKQLIEHLGMAAATFAQSIDVNRSSISHLLAGRNKPSLDVIVKILEAYPQVNLYWLLNGKGDFLSEPETTEQIVPVKESFSPKAAVNELAKKSGSDQAVDRIVIFYKDGSFKSYQNDEQ